MALQNGHDALWTMNGDLVKDGGGGIQTTHKYQPFLSKRQIIRNRIKAETNDWYSYKAMAANITTYIGQMNTKQTGKALEAAIKRALTYDNFINLDDLQVQAVPLTQKAIAIRIKVRASAPPNQQYIYELFIARDRAFGGISLMSENQ